MISPSQRPLPDNTQHSQHTNIQALGGIRTHDRSRRAAVDLCLRPRGHWDRPVIGITLPYFTYTILLKIKILILPQLLYCYYTNIAVLYIRLLDQSDPVHNESINLHTQYAPFTLHKPSVAHLHLNTYNERRCLCSLGLKGKHGHGPRKDVPKTAITGPRVTNSYFRREIMTHVSCHHQITCTLYNTLNVNEWVTSWSLVPCVKCPGCHDNHVIGVLGY